MNKALGQDAIATPRTDALLKRHIEEPDGTYDPVRQAAELLAHAYELERDVIACDRAWREERQRYRVLKELTLEARHFLNAQAYTEEEMDDFCKRLDAYFGIPSDR